MRYAIKWLIPAALVLLGVAFLPSAKANAQDAFVGYTTEDGMYANTGVVTEVNGTEIVFVDFSGNEWIFLSDAGDWSEGDRVAVIMDSVGTDIIYDDEVLAVKYCGWEY